jgi:hypothetical protein
LKNEKAEMKCGRHELFPNETETNPNVKIPNPKNGKNHERKNPKLLLGEWLYWHPILT